jgi:arginase
MLRGGKMNINIIGVPIHLGSDVNGVNLGPEKLREKNIIEVIKNNNHEVYDLGNIFVKEEKESAKYNSHKKMKYVDTIIDVNKELAEKVYSSLNSGVFPLIIGGDHSLALGSISGASKYYEDLAVIWIDAHGDINTHETTPSGNVHGMPLAASMGLGHEKLVNLYYQGIKVKKENVFIIGARDLDEGELKLIEELKLNVWTTQDIKLKGIETVMADLQGRLKVREIKNVHISFDIDCLDKSLVPGTGTPVAKGLNISETKYILKDLLQTGFVKSLDFVELNALLDKDDSTAAIAIDLIDCIFKNLK